MAKLMQTEWEKDWNTVQDDISELDSKDAPVGFHEQLAYVTKRGVLNLQMAELLSERTGWDMDTTEQVMSFASRYLNGTVFDMATMCDELAKIFKK